MRERDVAVLLVAAIGGNGVPLSAQTAQRPNLVRHMTHALHDLPHGLPEG